MMAEDFIKLSDWILAGCTLAGPVLAVQAQKWLERGREKQERRLATFRTLMATRATNLSANHVEALNSVPIDFYGVKSVMDTWEEYFTHLTIVPASLPTWGPTRVDLFIKLLAAIGTKVGYGFNVAEMHRIYFPQAHSDLETEQSIIRRGVVRLFSGMYKLPVEVTPAPTTHDEPNLQAALVEQLVKAYTEDGALKVSIVAPARSNYSKHPS